MYRTITMGSCVAVQGKYEKTLADGRIAVRVGNDVFVGKPVTTAVNKPAEKNILHRSAG